MGVTGKIGRRNIKLNKTRSAVTVIGIALSVALLTVIACIATSVVASTQDLMIDDGGNWHLFFPYDSLDEKGISTIKSSNLTSQFYTTQEVGYGDLSGEPYNVIGMTEGDFTLAGFYIVGGGGYHFDEGNVFVPRGTFYNGEELETGDKIETDLVTPSGETETFEFNVAGIIYDVSSPDEYSMGEGNFIITAASEKYAGYDSYFVLLTDDGLKSYKEYAESVSEDYTTSELLASLTKSFTYHDIPKYAVFAVFLFLIVLISQYCIKNSFDISVKERIRQLAILKSIGATSKQIRRSLYAETAIISLIAIPIGIGLGIGFCAAFFKMIPDVANLTLNINSVTLILAVFFSLLTVFMATFKSAVTASRVTPVETIKNTEDVKVTARNRKLAVPGFISKLFGVGGDLAYKNLVRNRKKYKTIEVSIVLCVAIFIIIVFFKDFFVELIGGTFDTPISLDIYVSLEVSPDDDEEAIVKETVAEIKSIPDISAYTIHRQQYFKCNLKYTDEAKETYKLFVFEELDDNDAGIYLVSVGDDEYERILEAEGLDEVDVKGGALLINSETVYSDSGYVLVSEFYNIDGIDSVTVINAYEEDADPKPVEIKALITENPVGVESACLIVSDDYYSELVGSDKYSFIPVFRLGEENPTGYVEFDINSDDPAATTATLKSYFNKRGITADVYDQTVYFRTYKTVVKLVNLAITAFIVTVALVGLTNMMNTVAANMMGRAKEFAVFRSIGMTDKEFRRMIVLEDMVFCLRAFFQAVFIAVFFILAISFAARQLFSIPFEFPWKASLASIAVVTLLMTGVTAVSLRKSLKQNIIETIRDDTF